MRNGEWLAQAQRFPVFGLVYPARPFPPGFCSGPPLTGEIKIERSGTRFHSRMSCGATHRREKLDHEIRSWHLSIHSYRYFLLACLIKQTFVVEAYFLIFHQYNSSPTLPFSNPTPSLDAARLNIQEGRIRKSRVSICCPEASGKETSWTRAGKNTQLYAVLFPSVILISPRLVQH